MRLCMSCGTPVEASDSRCSRCGMALDNSQYAPDGSPRDVYPLDVDKRKTDHYPDDREADHRIPPAIDSHVTRSVAVSERPRAYRSRLAITGLLILFLTIAFVVYLASRDRNEPAAPEAVASETPVAQPLPPAGVAAVESGVEAKPVASTRAPLASARAPRKEEPEQPGVSLQPATPKVGHAPNDADSSRQQIEAALHGWTKSLEDRDLNEHLRYYAPRLDRYYRQQGVGREFVRSDKVRALATYSKLNFDISNIQVRLDPSGRSAVATFDKSWRFDGEKRSSGAVQERLWLQKIGDEWRIRGERDLRVYSSAKD